MRYAFAQPIFPADPNLSESARTHRSESMDLTNMAGAGASVDAESTPRQRVRLAATDQTGQPGPAVAVDLYRAICALGPRQRLPWRKMTTRPGGVTLGDAQAGDVEPCLGHFVDARSAALAIAAVNALPQLLAIVQAAAPVADGDTSQAAYARLRAALRDNGVWQ